ncbi:hypothetical protein ACX80Z_14025 [Arthrobacter sp. TMT4-20]
MNVEAAELLAILIPIVVVLLIIAFVFWRNRDRRTERKPGEPWIRIIPNRPDGDSGPSFQQQQRAGLVFLVLVLVVFTVPPWIPALGSGAGQWVVLAVQAVVVVSLVVFLVRVVRKQRNDYWRERGRERM